MRFLPARALCEPIKSAAQSRAEEESRALETTPAGGCTPIGSSPGLIYRNIDQRGSQKQHDGAHQTSVQESQGNKNAHSPTRE